MKLLIMLITTVMVISTGITTLSAQEAGKDKGMVKKADVREKGMQDWLASFWGKVSKVGKKGPATVPTSVAGLRGSEQEKEKELAPYWKGKEKSKDGAAMATAESLISKKDFQGATDILKAFEQAYPDSPLKPIAALSLAYCYAQLEKKDEARQVFEVFLKNYPEHELAAEARSGIELLKGKNK